MAIKVKLEKDGFIKDGFVGYSYTTAFFNLWLPAFRLDFNGFLIFFAIYFFKEFISAFLKIYIALNLHTIRNMGSFSFINIALYAIPFFIGIWYNKYYTKKLLEEGWRPLENDEYSFAILKGYRYLAYTDIEMIDSDKMQRYKSFLMEVQKKEKKKAIAFLGFIIIAIAYYYFV